jgi:hypothetical protein
MMSVTSRHHSSDEQLTSLCPSPLQTIVEMVVFYQLLLYYHCSDMVVVTCRLPMATMAYDPLLQCLLVVVNVQ